MNVVVGLGNPGPKYRQTRHNVGFEVLAELAQRHDATRPKLKFEAEVVESSVAGRKLLLVAPQTYMNVSGRTVRKLIDFYRLPLEHLLVVCDDMNLDVARLRMRSSGSAGGQKGLQDIINRLGGEEEFARLRIGIGRPPESMDASNYVLGRFRSAEREKIDAAIQRAADAVVCWVESGVEAVMNQFNRPLD